MSKRRSNGDGLLRKRSDGRWESRLTIGLHPDGKPKYKYFYGATQKAVKEQVKNYQDDLDDGLSETDICFQEWSKIWFDGYQGQVSAVTYESYKYTIRVLDRFFGKMMLRDIKAYHVEKFLQKEKNNGRASSSVAKLRGMMYQIMNKAEANDLIRKNPVRFADKMRRDAMVKPKDSFTEEEVQALMEHLPTDKIGMGIRVLLGTGMRCQELLALEPMHVESDGSVIHVRQAVKQVKGTVSIGPPKTHDSIRDIPIPTEIRPYVIAMRSMSGETYIWQSERVNRPINPSNFRDKFKAAISSVEGVRLLTPHSTRHTYVSQLQAQGVAIETIQALVGHAEIDMTEHYLHVQNKVKENAVEKLDALFKVS